MAWTSVLIKIVYALVLDFKYNITTNKDKSINTKRMFHLFWCVSEINTGYTNLLHEEQEVIASTNRNHPRNHVTLLFDGWID